MIILILLFVIIAALFLAPEEFRNGVIDHIKGSLEGEKKKKPATGVDVS